jgi:hypothetical protein
MPFWSRPGEPEPEIDSVFASSNAVTRSMIEANARYDAAKLGEAYHDDVEQAVLRQFRLGWPPTQGLRLGIAAASGNPVLQRGIEKMFGTPTAR